MWKWIRRAVAICVVGFVGWSVYEYFRAGMHTLPPMPEGAFPLSYSNGLRAVMVGLMDETDTRRYFGYPFKVPFYLEDAWSFCTVPTDAEIAEIEAEKPDNPGERVEAICRIDIDGDVVVRGIITTVPQL